MEAAPQSGGTPVDFSTTLDPRTKTFTVIAALLGLLLAALDQTIVGTALPRIVDDLKGFELYAWVTTAYLLASTAMVPIYGKLGDILGRRTILLFGIVVFLLASVLCGAATSMSMLVWMRALQGIGAAALTGTAFAVVADLFEPRTRAKVQGGFGAVFGLSSVIGPVLGGFLTDHLSWRWVFYVNLPLGAVAIAFALAKMPSLRSGVQSSIDYLGALLLVVGSVPLLLALSLGGKSYAWRSPEIFALLAVGVVGLAGFVWAETRARSPLLPLRLFRNRAFTLGMLTSFFFGSTFFVSIVFIPLFMTAVVGVSATESGTTLMPLSIALVLTASLGGQLSSRLGKARPIIGAGLLLAGGTYVLLSMLPVDATTGAVRWRMVLLGAGLGPGLSLLNLLVQTGVEKRDIGVATSSRQFFQQLGSMFGAAGLVALFTSGLDAELPVRMQAVMQSMPPAMRAQMSHPAHSQQKMSFSGEGGGPGRPAADPMAPARQKVSERFDALDRDLTAAFAGNDAQARTRLQQEPLMAGMLGSLLGAAELPPAAVLDGVVQGARAGLAQARASTLAQIDALGRQIEHARKEAFTAALHRVFAAGVVLALISLLLASMIPDTLASSGNRDTTVHPAEL